MGIMWSESRTPFVPAPKELPKEQSANQLLLTTHDTDDRYRKTHSSPVRTSRAAVICCHICNNFPPRFDWTHRGCTRTLALGTRTLIISAPTRIKLESAPALFSSRATCNWQASNPRSFVRLIYPKFWKLLPKSLWWWDSKSVRKQEGWMAASLSHTVTRQTFASVGRGEQKIDTGLWRQTYLAFPQYESSHDSKSVRKMTVICCVAKIIVAWHSAFRLLMVVNRDVESFSSTVCQWCQNSKCSGGIIIKYWEKYNSTSLRYRPENNTPSENVHILLNFFRRVLKWNWYIESIK